VIKAKRSAAIGPNVVVRVQASLPTRYGIFDALAFEVESDATVHLALVLGDVGGADILVRVQSECLTGEVLGSLRCDCGEQLDCALSQIAMAGRGVLVYMRGHEGRGIGLVDKLRAYALQERGLDTVDANLALGYAVDERDYRAAGAVLIHLGIQTVDLLTNNPDKARALRSSGLGCRTVALPATVNSFNRPYLKTKLDRLGHFGISELWSA
jgi:3,4-dihydroxy 2-butanone 4-phosphate synthase / GTP cyclohydrolase II